MASPWWMRSWERPAMQRCRFSIGIRRRLPSSPLGVPETAWGGPTSRERVGCRAQNRRDERENMSKTPHEKYDDLVKGVHGLLKPLGFAKSGTTFRRMTAETTHIVGMAKHQK